MGKIKNSEETTKNLKQFSRPIFNQSINHKAAETPSFIFNSTRLTTTNVKQSEKKKIEATATILNHFQIFHQDYQFQRINLTCIDHTSFAA